MQWETKIFCVTCFTAIFALLWWSGNETTISLKCDVLDESFFLLLL